MANEKLEYVRNAVAGFIGSTVEQAVYYQNGCIVLKTDKGELSMMEQNVRILYEKETLRGKKTHLYMSGEVRVYSPKFPGFIVKVKS